MYQNRVLRKIIGANRVEVNVTQPTALSLPSGSVSHNSCLSLPADSQLPLGGQSSLRSSLPLTLPGHEPGAQCVLHVILVGTNAQHSLRNPRFCISLLDPKFFIHLTSNYCGAGRYGKAAGHNSTRSCIFPQQFLSWLQSSVYSLI